MYMLFVATNCNLVLTFVGHGMPYVPVEKSIIAANLDKIRTVKNLAFKSTGGTDGEIHLISKIINFEKEIQRVVDQPEKVSGMCNRPLISTRPPFVQDAHSVF